MAILIQRCWTALERLALVALCFAPWGLSLVLTEPAIVKRSFEDVSGDRAADAGVAGPATVVIIPDAAMTATSLTPEEEAARNAATDRSYLPSAPPSECTPDPTESPLPPQTGP
ncbi:MAG: hypothetical protein ACKVVP_08060 [Chloroflexota bacterium]